MKRYLLFGLIVAVVCAPLFFVALLINAAYWPGMDKYTLATPTSVRSTVAAVAAQIKTSTGSPADADRIIKLDPDSSVAWNSRCETATNYGDVDKIEPTAIATCTRANELDHSESNTFYLAAAQEAAGDFCTAEQTYTKANAFNSGGDAYDLRGMGRSAYQCGLIPAAIAELEFARDLDLKDSKDQNPDDDDDPEDYKYDLQSDREWLTLAYTASHQPKQAAEACSLAHPDLKPCSCSLQNHKPVCSAH
jgi:hypothetical protein